MSSKVEQAIRAIAIRRDVIQGKIDLCGPEDFAETVRQVLADVCAAHTSLKSGEVVVVDGERLEKYIRKTFLTIKPLTPETYTEYIRDIKAYLQRREEVEDDK